MAASILNHASGILTATAGFVVDGTGSTEHAVRGEPDVRVNLTEIARQGKDAICQEVSARREMTLIFQHIKLTRSTFPTFPQSTHSMFLLSILIPMILILMIACLTANAPEARFVRTDSADLRVELVEEGC